ncbi:hypothetical protein AMTR_s00018p00256410 [Amborella trichopoda]|uniref:Uncharacterized protein n=1 Tax=Amborella trichopoda TaxID=13333 RepID=W1PJT9_AMBTC|nr:hypothetical protein AMTR_s00018p00256410 [Amborella trichopoda]
MVVEMAAVAGDRLQREGWGLGSPPVTAGARSWRWLRAEEGLRVEQRIREKAVACGGWSSKERGLRRDDWEQQRKVEMGRYGEGQGDGKKGVRWLAEMG